MSDDEGRSHDTATILKQKQLGGIGQKQAGEEAVISYSLGRPRPWVPTCICIITSFAGVELVAGYCSQVCRILHSGQAYGDLLD